MKALLLVAHGSRRAASNDEVRNLAARLAARARPAIAIVRCGFLELAEPSIPDGIEECIREGATEVVVLPYFLSAGRHVVADIPQEVSGKQAQHPHVDISIAPYLGASTGIADLLLGAAGLDACRP